MTAPNQMIESARSWRKPLGATFPRNTFVWTAIALLVAFSLPTFQSLLPAWRGYNYSHAYLIALLTAYMAAEEYRKSPLDLRPSWIGFAALVALLLLTLAASAATIEIVAQAMLPLVWLSVVWAFCGAEGARRFIVPIGYFYFAIPFWDTAILPLQNLTVFVVSAWIRLADVPAFIEGNFIHLPSGNFEVMEGCAGLRYAIVAMALATFAGIRFYGRLVPAALLFSSAFVLALVGNWARVFIIVLVGYRSKMEHYLVADDHIFFGWAIFLIFMVPLVFVERILGRWYPVTVGTHERSPNAENSGSDRRFVKYGVVAALGLGIWANVLIGRGDAMVFDHPIVTAEPPEVPGWNLLGIWEDSRRPSFVGASAEVAGWYINGSDRVGAYAAHYAAQGQGHEVIFSDNRPQGAVGTLVSQSIISADPEESEILFRELEIGDGGSARRLVWVTYRIAGEPAVGMLRAKLLQISGVLHGRKDADALVLTATCDEDCSNARKSLSLYASNITGDLNAYAASIGRTADNDRATATR